jgi:hypothetical protein
MLESEKYKLLSIQESDIQISRKKSTTIYGLIHNELDVIYGNKKHRQITQKANIYSQVKVMDYAYNKYGSYVNYINQQNRIKLEKKIQQEKKVIEKNKRKQDILQLLKENNLQLRDDSILCNNYIDYDIGNINEIVTIMIEMDFYFKYTNYANIFYNEKSNYIYNMHSYNFYGNSYYSLSNEEKNEISTSSKKKALKQWFMNQQNYETAIKRTNLPPSLREKIKQYCK